MTLTAGSLWGAVAVLLFGQVFLSWLSSRASWAGEEPAQAPPDGLNERVTALELKVKSLPSLWEEERTRAEAAANRARVSRDRAEKLNRKRQEELDADDDVREFDAPGGRGQPMSPVPEGVGPRAVPPDPAEQMRMRALFSTSPI